MTGSATGMDIPNEGYEALKHHFKTGAMEVSSDEVSNCTIHGVSNPVNCVSCGEPLTDSERLNDGNCCDLCWLSN